MELFIRWLVSALSLWIVAGIVPGVHMKDFTSALGAVVVMALVNMFIKPIFTLFTLPITVLTLGLFALCINAIMFLLVGRIANGFWVDSFSAAIFGSLVFWIVSSILSSLLRV